MTAQPYSWVSAKKKRKLKFTESARGFGYFYLYFVKPTLTQMSFNRMLLAAVKLRNKEGTNDPQDEQILDAFS